MSNWKTYLVPVDIHQRVVYEVRARSPWEAQDKVLWGNVEPVHEGEEHVEVNYQDIREKL